ncbi:AAEL007614-PA, partial [Aedes aegypti]
TPSVHRPGCRCLRLVDNDDHPHPVVLHRLDVRLAELLFGPARFKFFDSTITVRRDASIDLTICVMIISPGMKSRTCQQVLKFIGSFSSFGISSSTMNSSSKCE